MEKLKLNFFKAFTIVEAFFRCFAIVFFYSNNWIKKVSDATDRSQPAIWMTIQFKKAFTLHPKTFNSYYNGSSTEVLDNIEKFKRYKKGTLGKALYDHLNEMPDQGQALFDAYKRQKFQKQIGNIPPEVRINTGAHKLLTHEMQHILLDIKPNNKDEILALGFDYVNVGFAPVPFFIHWIGIIKHGLFKEGARWRRKGGMTRNFLTVDWSQHMNRKVETVKMELLII